VRSCCGLPENSRRRLASRRVRWAVASGGRGVGDQSPIRGRSFQRRKSPLKPILAAIQKLAMTHRSKLACRTSQQFRTFVGTPCGIDNPFSEGFPSPVHRIRITLEFPAVRATTPEVCEGSSKPPTSHWRLSHRRNLFGSACAGFQKTSHTVTVHTRRSPMKKMAKPTNTTLMGIAEK
jgi:hypothetical protein